MESNPPKFHTLSLLQLIMGVLGLGVTLMGMLLLVALGARSGLVRDAPVGSVQYFSLAAVAVAYALLMLPSIVLPIYRLQGKALPAWHLKNPFQAATGMLALWPLLVLLGWFASGRPALSWFALPVLSVLTIAIPVWWLVEVGRRGLPGGSLQRSWGLLGYGVLPNMILILVSELLVILLLALLYGVYASTQPSLMQQLQSLAQQIQTWGNDPQRLLEFVRPYLEQPGTVFAVMGIGAVLMPMLEEALKPLGMWFIANRFKSPAEGFAAGLVCGGAFAFVESLNLAANMNNTGWTAVIFARVGSGLLHVVTSGLVGWGLVSAWAQGRYLRQALTFLAAIALHGLWNFFSLGMGLWSIRPVGMTAPDMQSLGPAGLVAPAALLVIAGVMLFVLFRTNRRLRMEVRPYAEAGGPGGLSGQPGLAELEESHLSKSPHLLVESNSAIEPPESGTASNREDAENSGDL